MKRRDIILDFTSLLDVTLIVIFFFVIFSNLDSQANKAKTDEKVHELEVAVQQAEHREANAKELEDQLQEEINMVKESDARKGADASEIIAFNRSKNIKIVLDIETDSWSARIISNNQLVTSASKNDSFQKELQQALSDAGYTDEDTIFCDFVYDGSKPGSNSAHRSINNGLKAIQKSYKHLYISETDLSIGD